MRSTTPRLVGAPRWVRGLQVLTALVIAAYTVWTLPGVRPGPAFVVAYDGVLQGLGYTLVAVLAVTGAALRVRTSVAWWLVAVAVALRAVGFVLALTAISVKHPLPYPSVADAAWVLSSLCLIGGVVLRLHDLAPRASRLTVLDGIAAALLVIALALGILASPIRTLTAPGTPHSAVVVNIGYPVLDTVLLVAAAALVTTVRLRLTRSEHLLLGGVVAFAAVDVVYFVLLAQGRWRPGSLLASLSLVATAVIATAVWSAPGRTRERTRALGEAPEPTPEPGIALPASLVAVAVLALAFTDPDAVPVSLYCYLAALVVVVCRGLLTVVGDREEADIVIAEAYEDARRFRALVEGSGDFIGMADTEGHVLYLNPQGRRMIGVGPEEDVTSLTVRETRARRGRRPARATVADDVRARLVGGRVGGAPGGRQCRDPGHHLDLRRPRHPQREAVRRRDDPTRHPRPADDAAGPARASPRSERPAAPARAGPGGRTLADRGGRPRRLGPGAGRGRPAARDALAPDPRPVPRADRRPARRSRRPSPTPPSGSGTSCSTSSPPRAATGSRTRSTRQPTSCSPRRASAGRSTGDLDVDLPEAERVTAYRIVKEALANAGKHARATRVDVELTRNDGGVSVLVRDDGIGVEPEDLVEQPGHLGIASMHNRADVAGGRLEVRRGDGGGTEVHLWLPLAPAP